MSYIDLIDFQNNGEDMAMEPGGRADKLGNEYERLWVVYQMLRVMTGEALSVTWEPPGKDGDGIDVLVEMSDGTQLRQSCKRENAGCGKWTISQLNARKVLSAAKNHLNAGINNAFAFISRDQSPELRDLSERASRYGDRADIYFNELPGPLLEAFNQLGKYWGLSPETVIVDRSEIFEKLKACQVIQYDVTPLREYVHILARNIVDAESDITRNLLADYAIQNLGNRLNKTAIAEFLQKKGLLARLNIDDQLALRAIGQLQTTFADSIRPYLIGGKLIERPESIRLIDAVISQKTDQSHLIMVHGQAGIGKSGVLFELVSALHRNDIPFLPLRLDRKVPMGSAEQYGRNVCGLEMSPALALDKIGHGRRAVLILDQLDALRWTAAHTDQPMDVLTEIVREALNPFLRTDITVVLVCRTFDLKDDPRIRHLKTLGKTLAIEIGLLSQDVTREIVDVCQDVWSTLTESQHLLLRHPQTLFLWTTLNNSGQQSHVFRTHTDLMRAFWRHLFEQLRPTNIGIDELQKVLKRLVEHIDNSGRLTAPASIIPYTSAHILAFLRSVGVIRIDERQQCVFTHQSYCDFIVADNLNRQALNRRISLQKWLKESDQSLFRRDQLRQVLALQRDDDPSTYIAAIDEVLKDKSIRFHLKHLIVRFLAQSDPPTELEVDLINRLIHEPEWIGEIYDQVVWNRPQWFIALYEKGVWQRWLESDSNAQINMALRMLGYMTRHYGDQITSVLSKYSNRDDSWLARIAQCLNMGDINEESLSAFNLRMELARKGQETIGYLWWENLVRNHPKRAVRLFNLRIRLFISVGDILRTGINPELLNVGVASHERDEAKWLRKAAVRQPRYVWKYIAPMCIRLERLRHWAQHNHDWRDYQSPAYQLLENSRDLLGNCEQLLVVAGRSIARKRPDVFKKMIAHWEGQRRTKLIERSLLRSLGSLPNTEADFAIQWIIAKSRRFRIGDSISQSTNQEPARVALIQLSSSCSDAVIVQLERAIMDYRDPGLKRMLHYHHENYAMKGVYYPNYYGRAQYILMSALPKERLSEIAQGQMGVWQRKFGTPPKGRGFRSSSGWVGSTIPHDRLQFLSDDDWLRLVTSDWNERNRDGSRHKTMGKNHFGEASHEHFANDMGAMARRQPSRFAKLVLKLPDNAPPNYMYQILRAFEQKEPPDVLTKADEQNKDNPRRVLALKQELAEWNAATSEELEAVISKIGYPEDSEIAKALCWLVEKRDDIAWSDVTIDLISQIASKHPNPASDEYASGSYDKTERDKIIPNVADSSLNCVRGVAALAIKDLLFSNQNLYPRFEEAITVLSFDDNVAVRAAAIAVCIPILNINRNAAVARYVSICSTNDDRVFESHWCNDFLKYALWTHNEQMVPIISRMARSPIEEVAKRGAAWVTAAWLYEGWCENLFNQCHSGSQPQRHGVAELVGQSDWQNEVYEKRAAILSGLFDDEDKDIRHDASRVFWNENPWKDDRLAELAFRFVKSRAFSEDPTPLIHGMTEIKGSLMRYSNIVFAIADAFASSLSESAKSISHGIASDVPNVFKLLLRVYQQAQDSGQHKIQKDCLDRWDALLRAGVGGYREAETILDATER